MTKYRDMNHYPFEAVEVTIDDSTLFIDGVLVLEEEENWGSGDYEGCFIEEVLIDNIYSSLTEDNMALNEFTDAQIGMIVAQIEKYHEDKQWAMDEFFYDNCIAE